MTAIPDSARPTSATSDSIPVFSTPAPSGHPVRSADSTGKYPHAGFYNLREAGGLHAANGRIRTGRLLRSDFPSAISLDAAEFFLGLPLGVVIDLRDPDEIDTTPKVFWDAGFSVVERPIFSGSIASMTTGVPGVKQLYLTMLERFPVQLAAAVGDVANSVEGGAVLVHCTAGKDRTGMVIALIQSLLGARDDDVIATYARTQANLSGEWLIGMHAKLRQLAQRDAQFAQLNVSDLDPLLAGSPPEAMRSALDWIDRTSGSAETFLRDNGLEVDQVNVLREVLLVT
ncbi:MAG: tyrosine-protein phosphatase [Ancrocorticia sp.]